MRCYLLPETCKHLLSLFSVAWLGRRWRWRRWSLRAREYACTVFLRKSNGLLCEILDGSSWVIHRGRIDFRKHHLLFGRRRGSNRHRLVGELRNILCIRADVLRHAASRFTSLLRRRSWIRVSHSLLFYTQRSRIAGPCCEHLSPLSYQELLGVFAHVGKGVCSFLKLGGGRLPEGDHFHLAPHVHVQIFNKRYEVAVASRKDDGVELGGKLHRVYRKAHIPVGLFRAIGEDLEAFYLGLDAYLSESVEEGVFLPAFGRDDVCDSAYEDAVSHSFLKHALKVDPGFIQMLCAVIQVLGINEHTYALRRMLDYCHINEC